LRLGRAFGGSFKQMGVWKAKHVLGGLRPFKRFVSIKAAEAASKKK
jgi:hypothetical protein